METNKQVAPNTIFKVREEILCKKIDDLCVLLDLRSGTFYTLNETASLFWNLIEKQTPIEDICIHITQQYDISHKEVTQDLVTFVDFFAKEHLLIRT